jgi:Telomere resolvase
MLQRVTTPQNVRPIQIPSKVASNDRFKEFRVKLAEAMDKKDPVKAVEKLCRAENRKFRKQFESMTTLRRYYTHYRNVCREVISKKKDRHILGTCLEILNLTRQEIDDLNEQYSQKVATEHRSLRPLKNYDQMILKAQELLGGMSIYDRILGLACLTGRRAAEIGCTAKFQTLRKDWMLFDGQLKGKTRLLHTYEIPVLADTALIMNALKSVREQRPLWVDNTILFHDCGSRELSLRVKRHFSEFIDNPAVKDLRASYAEICYDKFGTVRKAKTRFFSEILGHGEDDNITGQSYIDFYIEEAA